MLAKYQRKEFNFYADNSKFLSGEFVTPGVIPLDNGKIATPNVGEKALIHDARRGILYEVYIESLDYNFDFQSGYTLTWGFTRGLPVTKINDPKRWSMFWGHYADFKGGFFGENSFASIVDAAQKNADSSSSGGDGDSTDSDDSDSDDVDTTSKGAWIFPVKGGETPKMSGQEYGASRSDGGGFHDGYDIDSTYGNPIRAAHTGVVKYAGYRNPTYGSYIMIQSGNVYHIYQEFSMSGGGILVKAGDTVKKGKVIAHFDGGTHCHFGISTGTEHQAFTDGNTNNGRWHNPVKFIKSHS